MTLSRTQWWLVLGVETLALAALVAWILSRLDRLAEPSALLVGVIIIAVGDVATALIMQRFAPTVIMLAPGESPGPLARALGDFDASGRGRVLLRGERWRARLAVGGPVRQGGLVRIVARDGLTLVVEPVAEPSTPPR